MIEKRFTGFRDKTEQAIYEGSKVKVMLGKVEPIEWTGEVKEFNEVWYVVFGKGQHIPLASVAEHCEVL